MRSTIYLADEITNADRAFGSGQAFIPVTVVSETGEESIGFITRARLNEALDRGVKNPEDVARVEAAKALRARIEARKRTGWAGLAVVAAVVGLVVAML